MSNFQFISGIGVLDLISLIIVSRTKGYQRFRCWDKIGKCPVFLLNISEFIFCCASIYFFYSGLLWETGIIMSKSFITFSQRVIKFFYFIGDNNCEIMLEHYFFFLAHVNERMVCWILGTFTKMKRSENARYTVQDFEGRGIPGLSIVLNWSLTKYRHHSPIEALIITSVMLSNSMVYFYDLLWSGKLACFRKLSCLCA